MSVNIQLVRCRDHARLPARGTVDAAGWDIYSPAAVIVSPKTLTRVETGLQVAIPRGFMIQLYSRSGLVFKHHISVMAGTIDSDFRGEIVVGLYNDSSEPVEIACGDRICQAIIHKVEETTFREVDVLPNTERGVSGFGSTGR